MTRFKLEKQLYILYHNLSPSWTFSPFLSPSTQFFLLLFLLPYICIYTHAYTYMPRFYTVNYWESKAFIWLSIPLSPICLSILLSIYPSVYHLYVLTYYEPKLKVQRCLKACSLDSLLESLGWSQPSWIGELRFRQGPWDPVSKYKVESNWGPYLILTCGFHMPFRPMCTCTYEHTHTHTK